MRYITRFLSFWYHFIVGDDWRIAVAVVFGLSLVGVLVHVIHVRVWWLLPIMIVTMLSFSLFLATRDK
jgi:hypothetical protein